MWHLGYQRTKFLWRRGVFLGLEMWDAMYLSSTLCVRKIKGTLGLWWARERRF